MLISIIVPTFQSAKYLDRLLSHFYAQTHTDWEAIFVDNSSTDGTFERLEKEAKSCEKIRVFKKLRDANPTNSRNLAISHAKGEWVAFCDSDDFWHPKKLEYQIAALDAFRSKDQASIVFTQRVIWTQLEPPQSYPIWSQIPLFQEADPWECLYRNNLITNASAMVSRELLLKSGSLDERLIGVDDYDLYLRLSLLGRILWIKEPLTYYYVHAGNLSGNKTLMRQNFLRLAWYTLGRSGFPLRFRLRLFCQALKWLPVIWRYDKA